MQRRIALICFIGLSVTFSTVFAQSYFGTTTQNGSQGATTNTTPAVGHVLSDQEFKAKISKLSKESNDRLYNEIKQQLKPTPPIPKPPVTSSDGTDKGQQPEAIKLDPASTTQPARGKPLPPRGGPAKPTTKPSSQPYSGFGVGGGNQDKSSGSSSGSSNWNINY